MYDRRVLSSTGSDDLEDLIDLDPTPQIYHCPDPPDYDDPRDLEGWQGLLQDRHIWADGVLTDVKNIVAQIQNLSKESSVVQRSAAIAVENIKQHIAGLRPRYIESRDWADKVLEDQQYILKRWSAQLDPLRSIDIDSSLAKFIRFSHNATAEEQGLPDAEAPKTLYQLLSQINTSTTEKAAQDALQRFSERIRELANAFEGVSQDGEEIVEGFSRAVRMSDSDIGEQAQRLGEDIEVISRKIASDNEHAQDFSYNAKAISQLSRTATLQIRNFLPSIRDTATDIDQALQNAHERRNDMVESAARYMQQVSIIESRISEIHTQLANLDEGLDNEHSFDTLSTVMRLPSVYGSLLVECIQRQEWNAKMKNDLSSLAEETAVYREEETQRRRKWTMAMGSAVNDHHLDDTNINLEINVSTEPAEANPWPSINREAVYDYVKILQKHGLHEAHNAVLSALKILDQPTKAQSRRVKAFKQGSLHEGFGKNSLILRGDGDAVDELRSDKARLEDKLKSSESRVRKLEDLLHRQSQMSRPSVVGSFGNTSPKLKHATTSKPLENTSRRSSFTTKRLSANYDESKSLAQRIVELEAQVEKYRKQEIEKVKEEHELQAQVQDAVSTKEDLLKNMEAQQREFEEERRIIEHENSRLRIRLEEIEDEFDKVLENNDNDTKLQVLQDELAQARSETAANDEEAKAKVQGLQEDIDSQKRLKEDVSQRLQRQKARNSELQTEIAELTEEKNQLNASRTAFMVDIKSCFPEVYQQGIDTHDQGGFLEAIVGAVEKQAMRISGLEDNQRISQSEKSRLQKQFDELQEEIADLREDLQAKDVELDTLQRNVDNARDRSDALTKENADLVARCQELTAIQESGETSHNETKGHFRNLSRFHQDRSQRIQELSDAILTQNNAMIRLLEQVGFTVSRQDDTLAFQKAPKVPSNNASTVLNESVLSKSLSQPPQNAFKFTTADDEVASWISPEDHDLESQKYASFMREMSLLDPSAYAATIVRRVKEADHLARKYIKEARAQREKGRRAQVEAHDKIAFKAFKEGDLALFLPTRNQVTRPWAAFNIGAPHYFLREQEAHKLEARDWLLARISKVEERVVDLSKAMTGGDGDRDVHNDTASDLAKDENPFELSDGLRWYLLDAAEEKTIAPMSIASGKATVAAANVDAKGSIRLKTTAENSDLTKTLARSLDSRRSSTNSRKSLVAPAATSDVTNGTGMENLTNEDIHGALKPPPAPRLDSSTSAPPIMAEGAQVRRGDSPQ